jgi:starvation-inducible DNA-binding protein
MSTYRIIPEGQTPLVAASDTPIPPARPWNRPSNQEPKPMTATTDTDHTPTRAGFIASPDLAHNLQLILVDLIALHLQAKHAHWNLVGPNFRDLHLQLDEIVDLARDSSDTIAERMRALDATPDGRAPTVAGTANLTPLPTGELATAQAVALITNSLRTTTATIRHLHDQVDAEDPSTSDLLHTIIDELEKQAWMLSAETRVQ